MKNLPVLILFLIMVLGGGLLIGYAALPGEWYAGLTKPAFNPPNWVFPPAWTILYCLIAIAGWRTWERGGLDRRMVVWGVQLVLNFLWSPTFFAAHQMALGLAVILLLLCTILAFIALSWNRDRIAAWLFVPYAAWVAFATLLNASLLALN